MKQDRLQYSTYSNVADTWLKSLIRFISCR